MVSQSTSENCENVIIEAEAAVLAGIASDEGGPAEFVSAGVKGLITKARDADDFASAIRQLVEDRGLRTRMSVAARAAVAGRTPGGGRRGCRRVSTAESGNLGVKDRVVAELRHLTRGAASVEVNATDVSQALDALNQQYPGFRERLYDDKGQLRQFINIYRNDEDIRFGSGLTTQLNETDDLSIVPAVAGG